MPIPQSVRELLEEVRQDPQRSLETLKRFRFALRGHSYAAAWQQAVASPKDAPEPTDNPLRAYFEAHREGHGIWKWLHYFEIYDRHLRRFVDQQAHVVEVGIYSGGSLDMWKQYFGAGSHLYGVDIEPACKAYEGPQTRVFVGDQADRGFWQQFRREVPTVDVFIDDGGHFPEQQIVTLEEMLPHLRPGGVYICEDIHGVLNGFSAFAHGLADNLNAASEPAPGHELGFKPTPFQRATLSFHFYPFVCVIEKHAHPLDQLVAPRRGTEWQPFLAEVTGAPDHQPGG